MTTDKMMLSQPCPVIIFLKTISFPNDTNFSFEKNECVNELRGRLIFSSFTLIYLFSHRYYLPLDILVEQCIVVQTTNNVCPCPA